MAGLGLRNPGPSRERKRGAGRNRAGSAPSNLLRPRLGSRYDEEVRIGDRYLLREALLYFGVGLLVFTFVIFMREAGQLLDLLARGSSWSLLLALLYALPATLIFTLPMAALVGILIALGRMAGDQELVAMRAIGRSGWQLARPLLAFSVAVTAVALSFTLWLAPAGARALLRLEARLRNSQLVLAAQPRVFLETIPHAVVYIGDIAPGGGSWRQVFVADMRDPNSPQITMARRGMLAATGPNEVQLHLQDGTSYSISRRRPDVALASSFVSSDLPLRLPPAKVNMRTLPALATPALFAQARQGRREAQIELDRRLALAFACMALALLGIPLGLRMRAGGKAAGLVTTLLLVLGYYIVLITGLALAHQGTAAPAVGVWAANAICAAVGMGLLLGMDRLPNSAGAARDPAARLRAAVSRPAAWLRSFRGAAGGEAAAARTAMGRGQRWMPTLLDGYVIREFLGYVALLTAGLLVMILAFTFFELLGAMLRTHAGLGIMARYLFYLSPQMMYLLAPVVILVGVLITFGLMSNGNEITAMKACGISVYRLLAPIVAVALALAALQFGVGQSWLPRFNREQDALRARIKGQPARTYQQPERHWVMGKRNDIFYFQYFDPATNQFSNLSIYDFNPRTFELTRRIHARLAYWDRDLHAWVFESGWLRDFSGPQVTRYQPFAIASFSRVRERPAYFKADTRVSTQMNYQELSRYVRDLRRGGYNVSRLTVQLDKKIAYPVITLIMALLAFPFALSAGRRGTVAGIVAAIAVAIVYWVGSGFLAALGGLGQIPPAAAAWAPDLLFLIAGVYLLLRVPT